MIKFILALTCCFIWSANDSLQAQVDPFAPATKEDTAIEYAKKGLPSFEQYLAQPKNIEISRIEVEDLVTVLKTEKGVLHIIDARTREEYNVSHIKDAVHSGYTEFTPNRIWTIARNSRVIIYSTTSGKRSLNIAQYMVLMGYTDIQVLEEGLIGWKNFRQVVVNSKDKKTDKIHIGHKNNMRLVRLGLVVF
jgi:rhodanese-related sulfurtransferase